MFLTVLLPAVSHVNSFDNKRANFYFRPITKYCTASITVICVGNAYIYQSDQSDETTLFRALRLFTRLSFRLLFSFVPCKWAE